MADDQLIDVMTLSFGMFVATTAIGMSVQCFKEFEAIKNRLLVYGAGIMIGAAFIIIIPEGIVILLKYYMPPETEATFNFEGVEKLVGASMALGFAIMVVCEELRQWFKNDFLEFKDEEGNDIVVAGINVSEVVDPSDILQDESISDSQKVQTLREFYQISSQVERDDESDEEAEQDITSTTIGLVIHSVMDGLSMGISFYYSFNLSKGPNDLGTVIFFAILLHKLPTALGFGSTLMAANLDFYDQFIYLIMFTLSAPIMTILSYLVLTSTVGQEISPEFKDKLQYSTGLLLLFSSGTFLYVSTINILPRLYFDLNKNDNSGTSDKFNNYVSMKDKKLTNLLWLLLGIFTPLIIVD